MVRGPRIGVALLALSVLLVACGDDGGVGTFADGGEGQDGSMGTIDGGLPTIDAAPPVDGPMDDEGPIIQITTPTAPTQGDFSSSAIVTDDRFTVQCSAAANPNSGSPVDATSVRIIAFAGGSMRELFAQPTTVADIYEAQMVVSDFPNGLLTIRCTAADSQETPRVNSAAIETYLDLGPLVAVFVPITNASYANQLDVMFSVTAWPVDSSDTGAGVDTNNVQLFIAGEEMTSLTDDGNGVFSATALFDDPMFDPSLEGANTVTILAPNERSPTGTVRAQNIIFVADSQGPTITIDSPEPGELVSGIIDVTATIADNAGINDLSVIATMAGTHEFDLFSAGGDSYTGTFDTRELGLGMVFPTMVVRAQDAIGNQSSVGYVIALDNRPPMIDLDSPLMREYRYDSQDDEYECSWIFDPLGVDATDDGESVAQLSEMRVRIEDRANGATDNSGVVIPKALVHEPTVQMFILDDSDGALIVDTDGDGECDEINPLLVPTSVPMAANEAAVINMVAMDPLGSTTFLPPNVAYGTVDAVFNFCAEPDAGGNPAEAMCPVSSPATRRIHDHLLKDVPAIYGMPPVDDDIICMGYGFDSFATNISDGWACVAVRAEDNLGNVSVSAPMRVCFDMDGNQAECAAWGNITPANQLPDCTGTFDPMTGMTDAGDDCTLPTQFDDIPWLQARRIDI
jgi:hypothetical protein